jgi:hypothetical protein
MGLPGPGVGKTEAARSGRAGLGLFAAGGTRNKRVDLCPFGFNSGAQICCAFAVFSLPAPVTALVVWKSPPRHGRPHTFSSLREIRIWAHRRKICWSQRMTTRRVSLEVNSNAATDLDLVEPAFPLEQTEIGLRRIVAPHIETQSKQAG